MTWKSLPTPVKLFLVGDLVLAALYLANIAAGAPFAKIRRLVDLDGEANLPTWYSSLQWAATAALFAFAAYRLRQRGKSAALPIVVMALLIGNVLGIILIAVTGYNALDNQKPGGVLLGAAQGWVGAYLAFLACQHFLKDHRYASVWLATYVVLVLKLSNQIRR